MTNVEWVPPLADALVANIELALKGKREVAERAVICLMAEGHVLIEDVPGVGKTCLARALAVSLGADYRRIQFTPDLLPSDVTGGLVYSPGAQDLEVRWGPAFTNVLLADEINRASPKTQSALLEVMEERQITIDRQSYPVPRPYMVIATQNPIEMEGTYRLPEAQLDRFLMRIAIGYPAEEYELEMIDAHLVERGLPQARPGVVTLDGIAQVIGAVREVEVAEGVRRYVVRLAEATRNDSRSRLGASPRAVLGVIRAAQAAAARVGRWYVLPDDVQQVARPTLCHRIIVEAGAGVDGVTPDTIVTDALSSVPVPQVRAS